MTHNPMTHRSFMTSLVFARQHWPVRPLLALRNLTRGAGGDEAILLRLDQVHMNQDVPEKTSHQGRLAGGVHLAALQEELSQLEIERLHGTISGEEYASAKHALEGTTKRASARAIAPRETELPPTVV
jgi:hypothetical protein